MLCFRYRKLLMPYVENALDDRMRDRVLHHVARCRRCADELHALESMSKALRQVDVPSVDPSEDLWAKVSARISDESFSPVSSRRSWVPQLSAAGIAAVLVIIGYTAMRSASHVSPAGHVKSAPSISEVAKAPDVKQHKQIAKLIHPNKADDVHKSSIKPRPQKPVLMAKLLPEETNPAIKNDIIDKDVVDDMVQKRASVESQKAPVSEQPSAKSERPAENKNVIVAAVAPDTTMSSLDSGQNRAGGAVLNSSPAPAASRSKFHDSALYAMSVPQKTESEQDQISKYEREGNYEKMLEAVQKLLIADPDNSYYLLKLGEAYEHCGKKEEARAAYEKAASGSDPKYASIARSKLADMK